MQFFFFFLAMINISSSCTFVNVYLFRDLKLFFVSLVCYFLGGLFHQCLGNSPRRFVQ